MSKKNYYKILQVSVLASQSIIKKSYQKLVRLCHPDRNENRLEADNLLKDINEAYAVLSDPFKRKNFDQELKKQKEKENKSPSAKPMYETFHSHQAFSEKAFISQNQRTKSATHSNKAEKKICGELEISLEEAAFGCQKKVWFEELKKKPQEFVVSIPAGIRDKQKLKMKRNSWRKKEEQNFYAIIRYKKHPLFQVRNANILLNLPVPFTKAILGSPFTVPTLGGDQVCFDLPPFTQAGKNIQLSGQGFPLSQESKKKGNMIISISIEIPTYFSEEEKIWIKKLQNQNRPYPKMKEFAIKLKQIFSKVKK